MIEQIEEGHAAHKELLFLIKTIKFDVSSEETCGKIMRILKSAIEVHKEGKKVISWLVVR